MRLLDLRPRWLLWECERIGIMFLCPHCATNKGDTWLTCFFRAPGTLPRIPDNDPELALQGSRGERRLFLEAFRAMGHLDPLEACYHNVVNCKATCAWTRVGEDFDTLSVTPSLDASAAGHWHGHIKNGEIA